METKGITPQALKEMPQLGVIEQEFVHAYNVLGARRTEGLSKNPIQLSEIRAFIDLYGSPTVPIAMFVDLIGLMDITYLGLVNGNKCSS